MKYKLKFYIYITCNSTKLVQISIFLRSSSGISSYQVNVHKLHIYLYFVPAQWPRGLRRRSAAARLLRSWVRIPPGEWIFVCNECCVLSGRGLCDKLITRPEESYRLWCVVVCDLETSRTRRPWPTGGGGGGAICTKRKKSRFYIC